VLVSADIAAPKVAHAPLIDIPRNPGGYENSATVGAMVNCVSSHSRLPTPKSKDFYKLPSDDGSFVTNTVHSEGKILMNRATANSAAASVNTPLSETLETPRPLREILLQYGSGRTEKSIRFSTKRCGHPRTNYHRLIARAVKGLDNSAEARRLIYERARKALIAHLRFNQPGLSKAVIVKERLARVAVARRSGPQITSRARKIQSSSSAIRSGLTP
jgi:hypothetical protein